MYVQFVSYPIILKLIYDRLVLLLINSGSRFRDNSFLRCDENKIVR